MKSFNIYLIDICTLLYRSSMFDDIFAIMNIDTEEFKYLAFDKVL